MLLYPMKGTAFVRMLWLLRWPWSIYRSGEKSFYWMHYTCLLKCQFWHYLSEAFPIRIRSSGGKGAMKKNYVFSSHSRSGVFPSPGTLNYWNDGEAAGYQKGWSSERVPLPANCSRRYTGSGALLLFNNGRALPSKWEDAEKWISSPVSTDGVGRSLVPMAYHRRPKSKSGPLGPLGYSLASPIGTCFDGGKLASFTVSSPFVAGALLTDSGFCGSRGDVVRGVENATSLATEHGILRSASMRGSSYAFPESASPLPSSQNEKYECIIEGSGSGYPATLRRDVATQMSPETSSQPSPKHWPSSLPSPLPKLEVRDVQVDYQVTIPTRTNKKNAQGSNKRKANIIEWKRKAVEAQASVWEVSEAVKCLSKVKREEAKITAWENLQKAKAEAAIRKLEMKLEKERSSSMNKILKKLRSAQKKAEEMLSANNTCQPHQFARTTKRDSYFCKNLQLSSFSDCFTCHAF